MFVKNAKLCAAFTLGIAMAISSPLSVQAAVLSYEIGFEDKTKNETALQMELIGKDLNNDEKITIEAVGASCSHTRHSLIPISRDS